jgi:hypothetical protein
MTPNWDDPAISSGSNPTLESDRYSLSLIFLRVVGAANFPIQARQRDGGPITVDFPVPEGHAAEVLMGPDAPIWDLCARGLSLSAPESRPTASAWVGALESVLDSLGAAQIMRSVWATQGGGSPSPLIVPDGDAPGDVTVQPVLAAPRPAPRWTAVAGGQVPSFSWGGGGRRPALGLPVSTAAAVAMPRSSPLLPQAIGYLRQFLTWWLAVHRRTGLALVSRGRRLRGLRSLAFCMFLDLAAGVVALFVVAMMAAPVLGI